MTTTPRLCSSRAKAKAKTEAKAKARAERRAAQPEGRSGEGGGWRGGRAAGGQKDVKDMWAAVFGSCGCLPWGS